MEPDYNNYSLEDLHSVTKRIDQDKYPERYQRLLLVIEEKELAKEIQTEEEKFLCPNCEANLSKKNIDKLRYLVFGVRPIKCDNCKSLIQWPKQVRSKLVYLGITTNIGILLGIYSLLSWFGYVPRFNEYDHMVGTTLIAIGITGTISATKNAKIELVNET